MSLNPNVKRLIIKHMEEASDDIDYRRGVRGSGRMNDRAYERNYRDYRSGYSDGYSDAERDYSSGDSRRGVRGSGRRDGADYADMMSDYGGQDYHDNSEIYLPEHEIEKWKHKLVNNDGTRGPHFDQAEVMQAAKRCGINFDEFTKDEFCITMNMLYSDLCKTNSKFIPKDKEIEYYACLAKEWLSEDRDGPTAAEKLAAKYYMSDH